MGKKITEQEKVLKLVKWGLIGGFIIVPIAFFSIAVLTAVYWAMPESTSSSSSVTGPTPAPSITWDTSEDDEKEALANLQSELEGNQKEDDVTVVGAVNTGGEDSIKALESSIREKGYEEVAVRALEDSVQIVIEIDDEKGVPSPEEINELYQLAKVEFTQDSYITIEFQVMNE